jgi:hypothetical protein
VQGKPRLVLVVSDSSITSSCTLGSSLEKPDLLLGVQLTVSHIMNVTTKANPSCYDQSCMRGRFLLFLHCQYYDELHACFTL